MFVSVRFLGIFLAVSSASGTPQKVAHFTELPTVVRNMLVAPIVQHWATEEGERVACQQAALEARLLTQLNEETPWRTLEQEQNHLKLLADRLNVILRDPAAVKDRRVDTEREVASLFKEVVLSLVKTNDTPLTQRSALSRRIMRVVFATFMAGAWLVLKELYFGYYLGAEVPPPSGLEWGLLGAFVFASSLLEPSGIEVGDLLAQRSLSLPPYWYPGIQKWTNHFASWSDVPLRLNKLVENDRALSSGGIFEAALLIHSRRCAADLSQN